MELSSMKIGEKYRFFTKSFQTPIGDVILGETKLRKFIGMIDRGPVGMEKVPFVEVERDDGKRHLIAVETIEAVEPA